MSSSGRWLKAADRQPFWTLLVSPDWTASTTCGWKPKALDTNFANCACFRKCAQQPDVMFSNCINCIDNFSDINDTEHATGQLSSRLFWVNLIRFDSGKSNCKGFCWCVHPSLWAKEERWKLNKKLHLILEGLRIIHSHKDLLEQYAFGVRLHESKVRVENCFSFFQSLSVPDHPCVSGRSSMHYLSYFCLLSVSPAIRHNMGISKAPRRIAKAIPKALSLSEGWVLNLSNWYPLFSWERLLTIFNLPSWSQSHRLCSEAKFRELSLKGFPRQSYA